MAFQTHTISLNVSQDAQSTSGGTLAVPRGATVEGPSPAIRLGAALGGTASVRPFKLAYVYATYQSTRGLEDR